MNCMHDREGLAGARRGRPEPRRSRVRDHLVDVLTPAQFAALGDAMETVRLHLTGGACHVDEAASVLSRTGVFADD